jgi:3-deoxy-D-manno-octulosonic acid (KDO) 8-phosphate synthase
MGKEREMTYVEKLREKTEEQLLTDIHYQENAIEIAKRDLDLMNKVLTEKRGLKNGY